MLLRNGKRKLNEWYEWLVGYIPNPIKWAVSKAFPKVKNSMLNLYDCACYIVNFIVHVSSHFLQSTLK